MLLERPFEIVVSLPENSLELAQRAEAAGATALKVHLNCHHPASGTFFGSFSEEWPKIEKIFTALSIPLGVMPGHGSIASKEELTRLISAGLAFVDLYREDAPPWIFELPCLKMIALSSQAFQAHSPWQKENYGDILEASYIPAHAYGTPFSQEDFETLERIVAEANRPVFLPTQKKIMPFQLPSLQKLGLRGIILGAVVLSREPHFFEKDIRAFVQALS